MKVTIEAEHAYEIIDFLKRLNIEQDKPACAVSKSEIENITMSKSVDMTSSLNERAKIISENLAK